MRKVLIFSSFVASSRVGGYAQSLIFASEGVEARLVPTVLFGRHPGLGPPGGAGVATPLFQSVLDGAEAAGAVTTDAILTGYFAAAEQVDAAAAAIRRGRSAPQPPFVMVDPILGDADIGLYVRPEVERAVLGVLAPLADLVAPNLFELGRMTGSSPTDPNGAMDAARALGVPALVSSVPCGPGRIGVLYVDADRAVLASHPRRPGVPRGAGDYLKARFLAARLKGLEPGEALSRAVGAVAAAVEAAIASGDADLRLDPGDGPARSAVDLLILA